MFNVVLSINPVHVEGILSGDKRFEFRKNKFRKDVDKIYIYATAPISMIVAEAKIKSVFEGRPSDVWEETKEFAGISCEFYKSYYGERNNAVAYELCDIKKFVTPKKLKEYGINNPPQSFVYVKERFDG